MTWRNHRRRPAYALAQALLPVALASLSACVGPQTAVPTTASVAVELEAKKQRELALSAFVQAQERLHRVGYPILKHGVPICGEKTAHRAGFSVWTIAQFPDQWREAATSLYGVSNVVQVSHVVPDSTAFRTGIRAGDIPVLVNGWEVPAGKNAAEQFDEHLNDLLDSGQPFSLSVRRGPETVTFSVAPDQVCDYGMVLDNSQDKNAYADGERIVVHRGLMDFFRSDEELAAVFAHELAHNAMGHVSAKQVNAAVGGVFGLIVDIAAAAAGVNTQGQFTDLGMRAGAGAYSVEFEQEADYVGLYIMALAGRDVSKAPPLWRRMAILDPKSIQLKKTHPTTPERFIALEKTIEEIEQKKMQGLALQPNLKPREGPEPLGEPEYE